MAASPPDSDDPSPLLPAERIRELISPVPVSVDDLARHADLPVGQVQALLTEFELEGEVHILSGGKVQRSAPSR